MDCEARMISCSWVCSRCRCRCSSIVISSIVIISSIKELVVVLLKEELLLVLE